MLVDCNIGINIWGSSVILNVFSCPTKEVFKQMVDLWMFSGLVFKRCYAPGMGLRKATIKDRFLLKHSSILSKCLFICKHTHGLLLLTF